MEKLKNYSLSLSALGAVLSAALGTLLPWVQLMILTMVLDYATGMASACWLGNLCSKTGIKGIFKKIGYLCMVAVGMIVDQVLVEGGNILGVDAYSGGTIALMVVIWIIINELISILENLGQMEVRLPDFLHRIIQSLHSAVDSDNPNLKG